jgi:polysaccharide export outer membrane protein
MSPKDSKVPTMSFRSRGGKPVTCLRAIALFAVTSWLCGCASLPSNGPTVPAIKESAQGDHNTLGFKIVDIDAQNVNNAPVRNELGLIQLGAMSANPLPARTDQIQRGDVLTIAIYEVGVSLFGGSSAMSATADIPAYCGHPDYHRTGA